MLCHTGLAVYRGVQNGGATLAFPYTQAKSSGRDSHSCSGWRLPPHTVNKGMRDVCDIKAAGSAHFRRLSLMQCNDNDHVELPRQSGKCGHLADNAAGSKTHCAVRPSPADIN